MSNDPEIPVRHEAAASTESCKTPTAHCHAATYAGAVNFLSTIFRHVFRTEDAEQSMPHSIVLLMRVPFFLGKDALREPATRAFGIPYDDTDEMHFIVQTADNVMLKAGPYLISIHHKFGAYLGKTEDDVETGAAHLPETAARYWREQRAWASFDLMNENVPEAEAMRVLASLLYQVTDDRCCGLFVPKTGLFLANDGTSEADLLRWKPLSLPSRRQMPRG